VTDGLTWHRVDGFRVWAARILMLGLAGLLLWAGAFIGRPSWTAHTGGGTHGTFTVTRQTCDEGCEWFGIFNPSGGGPARHNVRMGYGHHGIHAVGDVVPAIDAGAPNVFPAIGGFDWLLSLGALILGAAILVLWASRVLRPLLRHARAGGAASRPI
jgi:hypothetical protein